VLGHPIAHSLSPVLHRAAYRALGLDWGYEAYDVTEAARREWLDRAGALGRPGGAADAGWSGFALTRPLKQAVLAVADEVGPLAAALGVANTLYRSRAGQWVADNSDVHGIIAALREARLGGAAPGDAAVDDAGPVTGSPSKTPGSPSVEGYGSFGGQNQPLTSTPGGDGALTGPATVLGAGATAASAVAALALAGVRSIEVWAREPARAGAVRRAQAGLGIDGLDVAVVRWPKAGAPRGRVVVSTLPAGAADPTAERVAALVRERGPAALAGRRLLDVAYTPWPTPLAAAWARGGGAVASGLDMLLHQAALQVQWQTGAEQAPLAPMRTALMAAAGQ
jgi:shikimate dehydrogenase